MKLHHGVFVILVLVFAYLLGVKFPSVGQTVLAKVGL